MLNSHIFLGLWVAVDGCGHTLQRNLSGTRLSLAQHIVPKLDLTCRASEIWMCPPTYMQVHLAKRNSLVGSRALSASSCPSLADP